MGVDRSDDFDVPSATDASRPRDGVDVPNVADIRDVHPGRDVRVRVEERRDRFEYYDSLRETISWDCAAERFRAEWSSHEVRWPAEARKPVDRSGDPEGSWRGDSGRFLDSAANAEVEKRCEQIASAERTVLSPAMREIEACDPERRLVGFEHRLKGLDRIKDKVAAQLQSQPELTNAQAMATVKDAVRFTFCYGQERYAAGVHADTERLESRGFEQVELRNSWADAHYKGINSRWREQRTGLTFEVQFHTDISFEAKQLTHAAYERIRDPQTTKGERIELEELQRNVTDKVDIPKNAADIRNRPLR